MADAGGVFIVDMSVGVINIGKVASKVMDVVDVCKVTGVGMLSPSGSHNDSLNKLMTLFVHMSFVVMVEVPGGAKKGVVTLDSVSGVDVVATVMKANSTSV